MSLSCTIFEILFP